MNKKTRKYIVFKAQQQQTPRNRIETETQKPLKPQKKCNQIQCALFGANLTQKQGKIKQKKREKIEKYVFIRIKKIQTILNQRLLFVTFRWVRV